MDVKALCLVLLALLVLGCASTPPSPSPVAGTPTQATIAATATPVPIGAEMAQEATRQIPLSYGFISEAAGVAATAPESYTLTTKGSFSLALSLRPASELSLEDDEISSIIGRLLAAGAYGKKMTVGAGRFDIAWSSLDAQGNAEDTLEASLAKEGGSTICATPKQGGKKCTALTESQAEALWAALKQNALENGISLLYPGLSLKDLLKVEKTGTAGTAAGRECDNYGLAFTAKGLEEANKLGGTKLTDLQGKACLDREYGFPLILEFTSSLAKASENVREFTPMPPITITPADCTKAGGTCRTDGCPACDVMRPKGYPCASGETPDFALSCGGKRFTTCCVKATPAPTSTATPTPTPSTNVDLCGFNGFTCTSLKCKEGYEEVDSKQLITTGLKPGEKGYVCTPPGVRTLVAVKCCRNTATPATSCESNGGTCYQPTPVPCPQGTKCSLRPVSACPSNDFTLDTTRSCTAGNCCIPKTAPTPAPTATPSATPTATATATPTPTPTATVTATPTPGTYVACGSNNAGMCYKSANYDGTNRHYGCPLGLQQLTESAKECSSLGAHCCKQPAAGSCESVNGICNAGQPFYPTVCSWTQFSRAPDSATGSCPNNELCCRPSDEAFRISAAVKALATPKP